LNHVVRIATGRNGQGSREEMAAAFAALVVGFGLPHKALD
jgi:hypothetical protein